MDTVHINDRIKVGPGRPFLLIAGPCVLESEAMAREVATTLREITERLSISFAFKASFDKANRTSLNAYRGPGLEKGLEILGALKSELSVPIVSDIHEPAQAAKAGQVLDIIQIPAFLCRQTDLLLAAGETGRAINLKKGQFLSPWDMEHAVTKIKSTGNRNLLLTERGTCLGYNNLVVDMRSLPIMRSLGCPVIFDATHSVQLPGGAGGSSGGQREFIYPLTRAAAAAGIDGLFMEVHPDPDQALCDGPNSIPLDQVEALLVQLMKIHQITQNQDNQATDA
ncbi:3-deoxy-8-phosphooctulonate synthase [Thermodesulfobacteriota bacterium]